jgi:hypothetical protein
MFQLLSEGLVDGIISKIKTKAIPYGFGGIAQIGEGTLPAELILNEHYRLKSELVILSRSFYRFDKNDSQEKIYEVFKKGIRKFRDYENEIKNKDQSFFLNSHEKLINIVNKIIEGI